MSRNRHPRPSRRRKSQRPPPGSAPGTLMLEPGHPPPAIRVISYSSTDLKEHQLDDAEQLRDILAAPRRVAWIDVEGVGHEPTVRSIAELIGMHKLTMEDVAHLHQRPKLEVFPTHLFIAMRLPAAPSEGEPLPTEQISLFIGADFVVTFQQRDRPGDPWNPVRQRLRESAGRLRHAGPDLLAYALIDAAIDSFFPVLEGYADRLDEIEDRVLTCPDQSVLHALQRLKRELVTVRRATWPLRDVLGSLTREQHTLIQADTRVYLRDCYDHIVQIIDLVETYRDVSGSLMDVYVSSISYRLNQVMQVLTVIATIFIPLTFIVGIYGMNFDTSSPYNMPELTWRFGYPAVMIFMGSIALGMLYWFYKRGWIGRGFRNENNPP